MSSAWELALNSVLALSIGGFSAILGLWVGRDKTRPVSFAVAMTLLIGSAVAVGIVQSVLDAEEAIQKQADLDRMIDTVTEIAMASGDVELARLIEQQSGRQVELPEPEPVVAGQDTGSVEAEAPTADAEGEVVDGTATQEQVDAAAAAAPTEPTDGAAAPAAAQE